MLKKIFAVMLGVGLIGGVVGAASALFTDTQTVSANEFTTGNVGLSTDHNASLLVSFAGMAPADSIAAPIAVNNTGSLDLRYSIVSTATDADTKHLMTQLQLTVYTGVSAANCTLKDYSAGVSVYGPAALGSVAGINVVGDPTSGNQTGDRTLAVGASEALPLCFSVELPSTTDSSFENAATTATFAFVAEQTKNNP